MSEKDMNIVCDRCKKKMRGEFDPDEPFKLWYSDREFNAMKRKLTKDLKLAEEKHKNRVYGLLEQVKKKENRIKKVESWNSRLEAEIEKIITDRNENYVEAAKADMLIRATKNEMMAKIEEIIILPIKRSSVGVLFKEELINWDRLKSELKKSL